jgi:hypothetical protein
VVTTFVFRVRNVPAALYKAMGGFATNGVNMTKLESYQLERRSSRRRNSTPTSKATPTDRNVLKLALEELAFFSTEVTVGILGVYPASGVVGRGFRVACLDHVRATQTYPRKGGLLGSIDSESVSPDEMAAWEECFDVARTYCTLLIEVHLGLNPEEERQLFHDLNRLGKKVDTNLALQFDASNPINLFIKERLISQLGLDVVERDVKAWDEDTGGIARKDLVSVNAILFLNRTNISGATPLLVDGKTETASRFWTAVQAIPGFGALEPIREVWIHDEWFTASRLSMMRIMARRTKATVVRA